MSAVLTDVNFTSFGELMPDMAPQYGAQRLRNAIPSARGYVSIPSLERWSTNSMDPPRGLIGATHPNGTSTVVAGSTTGLWHLDGATRTWQEDTPAQHNLLAGDRWSFSVFGDHLYAAAITEDMQRTDLTTGTPNWSNAATNAPKAKYLAVIKDWLFAANLDDTTDGLTPNRIQWSAVADGNNWPKDPRFLADFQDLQDSGEIMGIVGGDYGIVLARKGVWRIDYVGLPKIFDFRRINLARGCVDSGSIAALDNKVMYLSDSGWVLISNGTTLNHPGHERVDRYFESQAKLSDVSTMWSYGDANLDIFAFAFEGPQASTGQPNYLLIYHHHLDKWGFAEVDTLATAQIWGATITLEGLDTVSTSLDDLPASLDSPIWRTGRPQTATFDSSGYLNVFTGPPMPAELDIAEVGAGGISHSAIAEVHPVIDGNTDTQIRVAIGSRNTQHSPYQWTYQRKPGRDNVYHFEKTARYHVVRCYLTGNWFEASGVNLAFAGKGRYG